METPQDDPEVKQTFAPEYSFFLRRWISALCNAIDKAFFGLIPGRDRTMANLTWWLIIVGGVFGLAMAILGDKHNYHHANGGQTNIQFVLAVISATIMVAVYLVRSLKSFKSVFVKIIRSVFMVIWAYCAVTLGYFLFWATVVVLILCLFTGVFSSLDLSNISDSPNNDSNVKDFCQGDIINYHGKRYRHNGDSNNPWERI